MCITSARPWPWPHPLGTGALAAGAREPRPDAKHAKRPRKLVLHSALSALPSVAWFGSSLATIGATLQA
eukprot:1305434-Alexandrium_andersonii.AAC.1